MSSDLAPEGPLGSGIKKMATAASLAQHRLVVQRRNAGAPARAHFFFTPFLLETGKSYNPFKNFGCHFEGFF
jgi:hypothetical protein